MGREIYLCIICSVMLIQLVVVMIVVLLNNFKIKAVVDELQQTNIRLLRELNIIREMYKVEKVVQEKEQQVITASKIEEKSEEVIVASRKKMNGVKICSKCYSPNNSTSKFCTICGNAMGGNE